MPFAQVLFHFLGRRRRGREVVVRVRVTVRWGGCEGEFLYMYNTCKLPLRCFVRKTHRPRILHMHVIFNPRVCILYIIGKQTTNAMYLTEWREIPSWVGSILVLTTLKSIGILRTYVGIWTYTYVHTYVGIWMRGLHQVITTPPPCRSYTSSLVGPTWPCQGAS